MYGSNYFVFKRLMAGACIFINKSRFHVDMQIIHDDGKIFGLNNIIDCCIVLSVVCIVCIMFFPLHKQIYTESSFQIYFQNHKYFQMFPQGVINEMLVPEKKLVSKFPEENLTITHMQVINLLDSLINKEVLITVQGTTQIHDGIYYFNGDEIAPCKTITIRIDNSYFTGDIYAPQCGFGTSFLT